MINELIEQIGGRKRLEYILIHESRFSHDTIIMARALLAVLNAKPAGYVRAGAFERMKDGRPAMRAYHPLSPDDVKLYTIVL